jgi:hypothetical protein
VTAGMEAEDKSRETVHYSDDFLWFLDHYYAPCLPGSREKWFQLIFAFVASFTPLRPDFAEDLAKYGARAVLRALSARRVGVSEEERNRITLCRDFEQFVTWLGRVSIVECAAELFADPMKDNAFAPASR